MPPRWKSTGFALLLAVLLPLFAAAQPAAPAAGVLALPDRGGARASAKAWGLRAGLCVAFLDYENPSFARDFRLHMGPELGLLIRRPAMGLVRWQAELLFSQRGESYTVNSEANMLDLNYLEIPLSLRIDYPWFYLSYGFGASYCLWATRTRVDRFGRHREALDFEAEQVSRIDYSLKMGVGLTRQALSYKTFFEMNIGMGLNSLYPDRFVGNFFLGLTAGILFDKSGLRPVGL